VRTIRIVLPLLSLLLSPGVALEARAADAPVPPGARELVDDVVRAYGGRAALERVTAYRCDGRVVALVHPREGPTTRLFQRPDRLRVELRYPGHPELRIVDGARGWRGDGEDVESASGVMLDAMVLQAARAGVPWTLMEHADSVRVVEPREDGGRTLVGLELRLADGLTLRTYVDPVTHRVERSESLLDRGGMQTTFETVYSDFRKVAGVVFAFREENYASGTHTADTMFGKITLNPKLPAGAFGPPPPRRTDS